ncbi:MAG: tRNA1(Val) (adenine(37)-N6)-methyltransferase [Lachnospiraceae bacterium]|jgi:tRNA1Val (adenine37-N6)-methyltransferase|nr:tRNA1(Val) (adenine(37)-N6)-methyltransferase [Lachnospiraceae bacterium]
MLKENERIDDLQYKGLKIIQNPDMFCFGLDAVILSDFSKQIKPGSTVIDFGTGTGILPILLSKKTENCKFIGIEIQKEVAEMAKRSVLLNKLENQIEIVNDDINNLDKKIKVDAVVTNPPYKQKNTGDTNINETQLISRHEIKCTLENIAQMAARVLDTKGAIYMVHRPERLVQILEVFKKYKLETKEIRMVYPYVDKAPNLVLIKAVKDANPFLKIQKPLIVYKKNGEYTDEILEIYNRKQ